MADQKDKAQEKKRREDTVGGGEVNAEAATA